MYERRISRELAAPDVQRPRHVALMLDGNRRWAREEGFRDVNTGHRVGAAKIADLLGWCDEAGVEVVTLFLLSTDNLTRPADELDPLLEIIADVVDELTGPGAPWRLRVVGALDLLPATMAQRLSAAAARTEDRSGMQLNVAVGYGGRQEIADAVRKLLLQHAETGTLDRGVGRGPRRRPHRGAPLHIGPARSGPGHPHLGRAAAVGFPALAVGALGVLVLRGVLAAVPESRLPARPARLRRPAPPFRLLTGDRA